MPTGVAMRDAREQLFDAAERILVRGGSNTLTSRAVTTEAGCAKGLLHRHFADFDAFLAEFVRDRIGKIDEQAAALRDSAGSASVTGNLVDALTTVFGSVAAAIVGLVTSRDGLRARLRDTTPFGMPVLTEATAMITSYLTAERDLGRITADAHVDALALALIGGTHLLVAGRERVPPEAHEVRRVVTTVIADAIPEPES